MGYRVYRSIDGGTTWAQLGGVVNYARKLAVCPWNESKVTVMARDKLYTWSGAAWVEFLEDWQWGAGTGTTGGYGYCFLVLERDASDDPTEIFWVGRDADSDGKMLISDGVTRHIKTGNWNTLTGDHYCWNIAIPEEREYRQ
jgi:hypothetical protein